MTRIQSPIRPQPKPVAEQDAAARPQAPAANTVAQAARAVGAADLAKYVSSFSGSAPPKSRDTASTGATKLADKDLGVIPQHQGNTNACGTTSLANVMGYFGLPNDRAKIDDAIRPFDMFTAPDRMVDYARANGMRAEIKNNATLEDVASMVDQGVPPMVLIDPDEGDNFALHYVTVSGYERGPDGKISDVVIADSATGSRYTMSAEEFQQKWDKLQVGALGIALNSGLNNVMITAVPNDGRKITGADGVARPAADISLPSSGPLSGGFARGIANILSLGGQLIEKGWGALKQAGSAVVDTLGKAAHAVGDFFGDVGRGVGNFFKGLFG